MSTQQRNYKRLACVALVGFFCLAEATEIDTIKQHVGDMSVPGSLDNFHSRVLLLNLQRPFFGLLHSSKKKLTSDPDKTNIQVILDIFGQSNRQDIHSKLLVSDFIINGAQKLMNDTILWKVWPVYRRCASVTMELIQQKNSKMRAARQKEKPYIFEATVLAAHGLWNSGEIKNISEFKEIYDVAKNKIIEGRLATSSRGSQGSLSDKDSDAKAYIIACTIVKCYKPDIKIHNIESFSSYWKGQRAQHLFDDGISNALAKLSNLNDGLSKTEFPSNQKDVRSVFVAHHFLPPDGETKCNMVGRVQMFFTKKSERPQPDIVDLWERTIVEAAEHEGTNAVAHSFSSSATTSFSELLSLVSNFNPLSTEVVKQKKSLGPAQNNRKVPSQVPTTSSGRVASQRSALPSQPDHQNMRSRGFVHVQPQSLLFPVQPSSGTVASTTSSTEEEGQGLHTNGSCFGVTQKKKLKSTTTRDRSAPDLPSPARFKEESGQKIFQTTGYRQLGAGAEQQKKKYSSGLD